MNEEPPLSWRQKCIQEFSLLPLPSEWTAKNDALSKLSLSDDATWKRYHEFRKRVVPKQNVDSDDPSDSSDSYEGTGVLLKRCQKAFQDELQHLAGEGCSLDWQSHTIQWIEACNWEDFDDLRTGIYRSYIFSPYALPQALTFKHYYHHRSRMNWVEFSCDWLFGMLRFDGEKNGDEVQQKLAESWPKGWYYNGPTQPMYLANQKMEVLCANTLMDPPEVDGADWTAVFDINVSNFTTSTVRRLREWLFGCSFHSLEVMDNFSFLRLLFASCGSAGFSTLYGDIGYSWRPRYGSEEERKLRSMGLLPDDDDDDDDRKWPELNWLEYQARLVTGTIRPQDMFYQPYDVLEAKSCWGMNLLYRMEGDENDVLDGLLEEGETRDDIVPWVLWERAEEKQKGRHILDMMQLIMGTMGRG